MSKSTHHQWSVRIELPHWSTGNQLELWLAQKDGANVWPFISMTKSPSPSKIAHFRHVKCCFPLCLQLILPVIRFAVHLYSILQSAHIFTILSWILVFDSASYSTISYLFGFITLLILQVGKLLQKHEIRLSLVEEPCCRCVSWNQVFISQWTY